jgi:hypothetical protein
MTALMTLCAAIAAWSGATGGFAALSLAMDRHWEALHGRGNLPGDRQRNLLRWAGIGGLLLSLLVCLFMWGASQGWVAWAGTLTAAAIGLVLMLSYAASAIVRIAWAAGALCAVAVAPLLFI